MRRRTFVASGLAGASALAGCLGSLAGRGSDGSFETVEVDGASVPLAPIDVVYGWYADDEARMVDARSRTAYDAAHIAGAVSSPAPDGSADDPVAAWPTDARIVCYGESRRKPRASARG